MANDHISDNQFFGLGSKPSDQVPLCYTCRNRGWPHEPIILAKATGGRYLKFDYITGKPHIHKKEKPKVQLKSESIGLSQELFNEVMEMLISALDKPTPEIEVIRK